MAVLTMAVGIGANTTIFSMTNATLLRAPDAIEAPDQLVQIGRDRPDEDPLGRLLPMGEERTPENSLRVVGVAELDPDLGVLSLESLHERMGRSLGDTLTVARQVTIFALLAVILAGIGLYGVVSYIASSRTHEVGVRMALGAQARDILGLFAAQAVTMAGVGIAAGIGLTLAVGGLLASLLYGVSARDPLTLTVIAAYMLFVALIAATLPAVRTTRVNPVSALRQK